MSAELLRRAAEVLRERANDATPDAGWSFSDGGKRNDGTEPADSGLLQWIRLMSPDLGLALADLLNHVANDAESNDMFDGFDPWVTVPAYGDAMNIARLILGGA